MRCHTIYSGRQACGRTSRGYIIDFAFIIVQTVEGIEACVSQCTVIVTALIVALLVDRPSRSFGRQWNGLLRTGTPWKGWDSRHPGETINDRIGYDRIG